MDGFGKRLRMLRHKRGLTIGQICSRVGVTGDAILKLESGSRGKTFEKLPAIAKALGCRIDDLFPEMDDVSAPEKAETAAKSASDGAFEAGQAEQTEEDFPEGWAM